MTSKPKPDIEDWQSARRRRGEGVRARNRDHAEKDTQRDKYYARQARFQDMPSRDTKGTPLSPLKRGSRGGAFNPAASIKTGIGRRVPFEGFPNWNAADAEYKPQGTDRGASEVKTARRRAIDKRFGKN